MGYWPRSKQKWIILTSPLNRVHSDIWMLVRTVHFYYLYVSSIHLVTSLGANQEIGVENLHSQFNGMLKKIQSRNNLLWILTVLVGRTKSMNLIEKWSRGYFGNSFDFFFLFSRFDGKKCEWKNARSVEKNSDRN